MRMLLWRIWELDDQTLRRFLLVVHGHNDQWYWTGIARVERVSWSEIVIHGYGIPFHFTQTLYGMESYDENGQFISARSFEHPVHVINSDVLNVNHRFSR